MEVDASFLLVPLHSELITFNFAVVSSPYSFLGMDGHKLAPYR